MNERLRRREFLKAAGWAAVGPLVVPRLARGGAVDAGTPVVAHAHHGRSALWSGVDGRYGESVDQDAVNLMLDRAVQLVKGGSTEESWRRVFSLSGNAERTLAIKINCNNAVDPVEGAGPEIDAIPQPCIATIRGFVRAGGRSANCHIFDGTNTTPTRHIATWFRDVVRAAYPDVQFHAAGGGSVADGDTEAFDPATHVTWDPAHTNTPPETRVYVWARSTDYLVNVPIVKRHGQANVTLGYKNHLGSVSDADALHEWLYQDVPEASVLVDIMGSPTDPGDPSVRSIRERSVLTVGDMLYGQPCRNWGVEPRPWETFGGEWPGSLVVSDDPVAADSVMLDILQAEPGGGGGCGSIRAWARRYLQIAADKGQGAHETIALPPASLFDPALLDYQAIDYRYLELQPSGAALSVSLIDESAVLLEWEHYFPDALCEVRRATRPDFSDAVVLGASPTGAFIDNSPPPRAYYRIFLVT
jgi:hypothetical protein